MNNVLIYIIISTVFFAAIAVVSAIWLFLLKKQVKLRTKELENEIDEHKRAEDKLRESEELFSKIFHTSPAGMIITTMQDGRVLDINKSYIASTGYERKKTVGRTTFEFGFWADFTDRKIMTDELEKHGFLQNSEFKFHNKSGEIRWGIFSAELINIKGEQCVITSLNDITERKRSEEALKESEEKYRSMMESMVEAAYICSSGFRIDYMNSAMIKRTGYNATGELCYKAMHGLDEKCPWCVSEKVMEGESINYETVSPKDDKNYHISNSPIFHADGSVSKLTVFRDITDFKKMERQLQQSQKMESIGTLAGGIAHDFNNILFPILGHTEMLIDDLPEESPFRNTLNEVYTSALRARELVKQILAFSRQDTNELKLMKMQPVIKEALKFIRSTIPTTIEIKQNIRPDCAAIKADPTQIHQIVMNLATNAYHAMEETGGELKVSLKEIESGDYDVIHHDMTPGVYTCLTVADSGTGMDKDLTEKIFDPFFTTKETGKGTGMGLSVVHGIVTSMKGAVKVYSEPGKGTEFNVYLPVVKSSFEKQETRTQEAIQGGTEQILLVDDEEVIVTIERQMLERLGYQVTSRISSIEALEAFRTAPDKFDLVITDMAMPNMSGYKLSAELAKIRPGIPILLCTGFSEIMSEETALSLGIKGFLMKPIIMRDLSQKIREVLDA